MDDFRVLIADDEYWIRQSLLNLIDWRAHGFICLEPAVDGEDAWRKVEAGSPHIVLLDINMPFVSGIELTKRLRASYPDVAVLILSGYSDFETVRDALTHGAVDYLLKPAEPDKLLAALKKATDALTKNRAQSQAFESMRTSSRLASSMLTDRSLSALLDSAAQGGAEQDALWTEANLHFGTYHLIQLRVDGLKQCAEAAFAFKQELADGLRGGGDIRVFHYVGRTDTFYALAELPRAELLNACQRMVSALSTRLAAPVTCLVSGTKASPAQLKDALTEIRQLGLIRPFKKQSGLFGASEHGDAPIQNRISAQQRRELELAVRARSLASFQRVLNESIGIGQCRDGNWRYMELLHALNTVAFILRQGVMEGANARRAMAFDNLLELMLVAVDRFDADEVFTILGDMLSECFGAPDDGQANEGMHKTVAQVKAFVEAHYFEDLSLSLLAHRFLVDDGHLSRMFKQLTGENLTLYIARTRIERAQALIGDGQLSLTEIASAVGYDDYAYFNRVFRKIAGLSPRAYKEGHAT